MNYLGKEQRRVKPGRGSSMCKSMDTKGAWYLLETGSMWQWGALEDLGQVNNMMRFSRETTLVAVWRMDLKYKSGSTKDPELPKPSSEKRMRLEVSLCLTSNYTTKQQ